MQQYPINLIHLLAAINKTDVPNLIQALHDRPEDLTGQLELLAPGGSVLPLNDIPSHENQVYHRGGQPITVERLVGILKKKIQGEKGKDPEIKIPYDEGIGIIIRKVFSEKLQSQKKKLGTPSNLDFEPIYQAYSRKPELSGILDSAMSAFDTAPIAPELSASILTNLGSLKLDSILMRSLNSAMTGLYISSEISKGDAFNDKERSDLALALLYKDCDDFFDTSVINQGLDDCRPAIKQDITQMLCLGDRVRKLIDSSNRYLDKNGIPVFNKQSAHKPDKYEHVILTVNAYMNMYSDEGDSIKALDNMHHLMQKGLISPAAVYVLGSCLLGEEKEAKVQIAVSVLNSFECPYRSEKVHQAQMGDAGATHFRCQPPVRCHHAKGSSILFKEVLLALPGARDIRYEPGDYRCCAELMRLYTEKLDTWEKMKRKSQKTSQGAGL